MSADRKPDPEGGCGLMIFMVLVSLCVVAVMAAEVFAGIVK